MGWSFSPCPSCVEMPNRKQPSLWSAPHRHCCKFFQLLKGLNTHGFASLLIPKYTCWQDLQQPPTQACRTQQVVQGCAGTGLSALCPLARSASGHMLHATGHIYMTLNCFLLSHLQPQLYSRAYRTTWNTSLSLFTCMCTRMQALSVISMLVRCWHST